MSTDYSDNLDYLSTIINMADYLDGVTRSDGAKHVPMSTCTGPLQGLHHALAPRGRVAFAHPRGVLLGRPPCCFCMCLFILSVMCLF